MTIQFSSRVAQEKSPTEADTSIDAPVSLTLRIQQALAQRVQKEEMAAVASLGKQMAKDQLQAKLDTFRIEQAERVGSETLVSATKAMARNSDYAQHLVLAHPELETDILQMLQEQNDLLKQLPRVGTVAYMRRYFPMDTRRDP